MSYEVPLRAFCLLVLILCFFYLSSIIPQLFSLFSIWGLGGRHTTALGIKQAHPNLFVCAPLLCELFIDYILWILGFHEPWRGEYMKRSVWTDPNKV